MADLKVRIVRLQPASVASVHGFGTTPELLAWEQLTTWAEKMGMLEDGQEHRVFGFNNPDPSPGSPNYGYEFWVTVAPGVQSDAEVTLKDFAGGRYAVARCEGVQNIAPTWQELSTWVEDNGHEYAPHQWLEEKLGGLAAPIVEESLTLDLYFPIAE